MGREKKPATRPQVEHIGGGAQKEICGDNKMGAFYKL